MINRKHMVREVIEEVPEEKNDDTNSQLYSPKKRNQYVSKKCPQQNVFDRVWRTLVLSVIIVILIVLCVIKRRSLSKAIFAFLKKLRT